MIKYQVYEGQSLLDIAIQFTGTPTNALFIAKHNLLNPSDSLMSGIEIEIPDTLKINNEILKYIIRNNIKPATALTQTNMDAITGCEGIGCWAIGIDFKVS
ncbi:hypothetical protein [Tenacibaculum piscium]|uniref:hypothetical protein n=1 Tax=Tenacibaculum piscium TaxID=1458515 RepID=UPI001F1C38B8|nr:hypothetical protein [Tenacibaculum piscium]